MTPLDKARRIIELHGSIKAHETHLSRIEEIRKQGTSIEIIVSGPNSRGYNETLMKTKQTFQKGTPSDIASIILARLSDEHASKLRLLKTELANLEAGF